MHPHSVRFATASTTGVVGSGPVAYAAAKAAVIRATEVLADELRPDRIRVNCVLSSVIDTPAPATGCPRTRWRAPFATHEAPKAPGPHFDSSTLQQTPERPACHPER